MPHRTTTECQHPVTRRAAIQAGAIGLLGLGMNHLEPLRAAALKPTKLATRNTQYAIRNTSKSVIYIFLSGGLSQLDSFDLKPDAPEDIRGAFKPISTKTPGVQICEHLPMLAQRSQQWTLVRSLTHKSNDHSLGHHIMLTGRSETPTGFNPSVPKGTDYPSVAAMAGAMTPIRNNLPPAVVLPEKLVHYSGRVIPGQFAGEMGPRGDPWFVEASPFDPLAYGAYPQFEFDHQEREHKGAHRVFQAPNLTLPESLANGRLTNRLELLKHIDRQRADLDRVAQVESLDRHRQRAVMLLTDQRVRRAMDVTNADAKTLDRYGRNTFGWSLLMARRLIDAGVNLVQVNLGNNETWDTHGNAFPHLKDNLFPPTDRALSALLDDLNESGLLDSTLIVMAGEFGRTPKISTLPQYYKLPGRDHWAPCKPPSSPAAEFKAGASSAPPITSAATPQAIRKRPRIWRRRSITRSAFLRQRSGMTSRNARITSTTVSRSPGSCEPAPCQRWDYYVVWNGIHSCFAWPGLAECFVLRCCSSA